MTDLQKFIELYQSLGIELNPTEFNHKIELRFEEGDNEKLVGYKGFYTIITFEKDGRFVEQGFYE